MSPIAPDLDVLIVTYNNRRLIQDCLDSLLKYAPRRLARVYVADNNSPDHTADVIAGNYPSVELYRRRTNDGFAVANNDLIRTSTSNYLLILNPDTRFEMDALSPLLTTLDETDSIGMIGCRLLTADGTPDHAAKRSFPSPAVALHYFFLRMIGRKGSSYIRPDIADNEVADVDAINGAFMLVRRHAVDEVGGFDERYWMYAEDLDWCARFAAQGWRVVYDGRVIVRHMKAGSTRGQRPPRLNYHFHRSMALFYRKYSTTNNPLLRTIVEMGIWSHFVVTTVSYVSSRGFRRTTEVTLRTES